ncbi:hypothetical protein AVEN_841-1, partial [Araneus ventricosus]
MDSSRSAQRAIIQFIRADGEHASQIYHKTKEPHLLTNSATISAVDEFIRQNRRITTREIAVELSISKGTVHHIIHKKLGYGKVCAQQVPKHPSENQNTLVRKEEKRKQSLTKEFANCTSEGSKDQKQLKMESAAKEGEKTE